MTTPRSQFLQLHFLTSYPASLINRDDAGFAKRIPFGGASRTRISSQCQKRHWRTYRGPGAFSEMGQEGSVRSRLTFHQLVFEPLVESGVDTTIAREVVSQIMGAVLGESPKAKKKKKGAEDEPEAPLQTSQLTVLGRPEVGFLLDSAKSIAASCDDVKSVKDAVKAHFSKDVKKNLQTLAAGSGFDAALFGRMVTSDILSRSDAALHVAHAMTVHAEQSEPDYFSAVDDLLGDRDDGGDLGSAHIGTTELTSGIFYGYVAVDVSLLVSNLEGCPQSDWAQADMVLASEVVKRLPRILATVSPGAKKGSTAPYAYAHLMLAEVGPAQPRTFANAFLKPVALAGDPIANAFSALANHVSQLDEMYGVTGDRRAAAIGDRAVLDNVIGQWLGLDELGAWLAASIGVNG